MERELDILIDSALELDNLVTDPIERAKLLARIKEVKSERS